MQIRSYKDLDIWKRGRVMVKTIYQATHRFPKREMFGLTNQLRRAAVSVPQTWLKALLAYTQGNIFDFSLMLLAALRRSKRESLLLWI